MLYILSRSHDSIVVSTFSLQGRLKLHTSFRHEPKKTVPLVLVQWKEFKQAGILELQECTNKGWADGLGYLIGVVEDCPVVQHLVRCYPSMCSGNSMLNHLSQVEKVQDHRVHEVRWKLTQRMEAWKMGSRDLLMNPTETIWNFNLFFSMVIQFRSRSPSQSWSKPRSCKVGGLLPHPRVFQGKYDMGPMVAWCFQPLSVT